MPYWQNIIKILSEADRGCWPLRFPQDLSAVGRKSKFDMSFAELRRNRQSKDIKSCVKQLPEAVNGEALATVQPQISSQPRAHPTRNIDNHGGLYSALPPSMELRTSQVSGRGLWNRTKVNAGKTIAIYIRSTDSQVNVGRYYYAENPTTCCCTLRPIPGDVLFVML